MTIEPHLKYKVGWNTVPALFVRQRNRFIFVHQKEFCTDEVVATRGILVACGALRARTNAVDEALAKIAGGRALVA